MADPQPASTTLRSAWAVAVIATLLLLALPWALAPDGHPHAGWQQFLGRFHPLAIHLPIALLLLVPILEFAGQSRPALRETASFVLACAAVSSVVSAILGSLLAHGGGFTPEAVRGHMWSAILLTITIILCTLLRLAQGSGGLYRAALLIAILLTFWTGHQGGALTYGKGYLTQFAPSLFSSLHPRRAWPPVDPASVYATRIQPILNTNCVSCHGPAKRKGGLQLDTYAHLMDGGTSGEVIDKGHPESSILYTRITLPHNDRKFMPSEGKPPLSATDIALIESWIRHGASPLADTPAPAPLQAPASSGH